MFRVTIGDNDKPVVKNGVSKRTGQPYSINEQPAIVSLPNGERRRITMGLENGDVSGLAPGEYEPGPSAGFVGDFGALAVSTKAKHWQPVAGVPLRKVG